jgi:YD repeat-containing protein
VTNQTAYGDLTAVTLTGYDNQGRTVSWTDALGDDAKTGHDSRGQALAQWGATYPVAHAYDTSGRKVAMATSRDSGFDFASVTNFSILNPNSSLDVTRWLYDSATELLTNKIYADGLGPSYAYTSEGLLQQRTWARGDWVTYAHDAQGRTLTNAYSSAETPDVSFTYNAAGILQSVTDAASVTHT